MSIEIHSFDWSGAGEHGEDLTNIKLCFGIAGGIPAIRPHPVDNTWSRVRAFKRLCQLAQEANAQAKRVLVGMDFAFSFPFASKGNVFPHALVNRAGALE